MMSLIPIGMPWSGRDIYPKDFALGETSLFESGFGCDRDEGVK